jgi:hypothetical protein
MSDKKAKKAEGALQKALKSLEFSTATNLTDKDPDSCELLCAAGAVESLLGIIEGQLAQGIYSKVMNGAVDVLYNISKIDKYLRRIPLCL